MEDGQALTEYMLITGLVVIASLAAVLAFRLALSGYLEGVYHLLSQPLP